MHLITSTSHTKNNLDQYNWILVFAWKARDMIEFWYISPININNKRILTSIVCFWLCYVWSLLCNPSYFLSFLGGRFDVRSLLKREVRMHTTRVMLMITHVAMLCGWWWLWKKFKLYFLCLMKCFSAWDECHSTPSCPNLSFLYVLTINPNHAQQMHQHSIANHVVCSERVYKWGKLYKSIMNDMK